MGFLIPSTDQTGDLPTVIDTHVGQRTVLTFSVEGLSARDELLFKGYVRLLDHLTDQEWQYKEASAQHRVDLLVASEHVLPTRAAQASSRAQPVLLLGSTNLGRSEFFLFWPLKPKELEDQLNKLGLFICFTSKSGHDASVSAASPAPTQPVLYSGAGNFEPVVAQYRLRQWPRPMLLAEPGRMRLATLLSSRALSIDELVVRTGLPKLVCERFVADMQTAGLIAQPEPVAKQQLATAATASASASASAALADAGKAQNGKPAAVVSLHVNAVKSAVSVGLIDRIRMRFGIKSLRLR